MKKSFCLTCDDDTEYYTKNKTIPVKIHGIEFTSEEVIPYCTVCNSEMYVTSITDRNCAARKSAYIKALPYNLIESNCEHVCAECGKMSSFAIDLDSEAAFCSKSCLDSFYKKFFRAAQEIAKSVQEDPF